MNLTYVRDRSVRLVEGAALELLIKRGYQLSHASFRVSEARSPGPRFRVDKGELIDYAFARCSPRPASFADLGGVWGVQGEYTFYALEAHRPRGALLVDNKLTTEVVNKAERHQQLKLLKGNFGTESIASKVRGVDAIFLFDVLLHQVNPDWDRILEMYAGTAKYLLIYNQQWTGEKTVRLLDLGPGESFRNTPREPTDRLYHNTLYQELFDKMHELHPEHNRPWRDIYNVWQWGITDADLIATVEALGFRLQYYKNCGRFGQLPNFENHAFVFKREDLPT